MEKIAHNHKLIIFGILKFKSVHIGYRDQGFKIGYRDQGFKTKNTLQKVSTSGQFLVFYM